MAPFRNFAKTLAGLLAGASMTLAGAASAGTLVINSDTSDPAPKAAWEEIVAQFGKDNPDIKATLNVYDHESYKKSIRNWLSSASPDIVFWYVGTRMKQFTKPGLLEDVSDIFTKDAAAELGPVATGLVTDDGKQYGVPYTYYNWGVYYRKDLFDKAGVKSAPKDWAEFLDACDKIKASGIEPIVIGSKDLWPTAGWFDYIDMRLNGLPFHMDLMGGKVSYLDPKVKAVFGKWAELLNKGCFVKNHASVSWQESQSLLFQGKASMMLIGNFIAPNFPKEIEPNMAFFRFPDITPGMKAYEDAPMDSIHIPKNAKNKEDARKFLKYVMTAPVQEKINMALGQTPINAKSAVKDERFLKTGSELLGKSDGLAQFFDRDTDEAVATLAMKGFQEFMVNPDRADAVLTRIDAERKRVYGGQ
jgi:multiple sugar transport system substrate-binding protein